MSSWPELYREMSGYYFLRVVVAFGLCAVGLVAAAFATRASLRWFFAILLGLGTSLVSGYRLAVGEITTYFNFVTTIDASSALADAMAMHGAPITIGALLGICCVVAIGLRPSVKPGRLRWIGLWVAPLFVLLLFFALISFMIARQGQVRGLPSSWQGVGFAALYTIDRVAGRAGKREVVSLSRDPITATGDIVLIIDESVSGNYLDINAPAGGYSGLKSPPVPWKGFNFGISVSPTNCSMQSNVVLRYGGLMHDYQQKIARGPSIWAHAKAAGLRTVYLYGQRGGEFENYMTEAERAEIDDAVYFEQVEMPVRDLAIAAHLAARLDNDIPEFVLVNKLGVHYPAEHLGIHGAGDGEEGPVAMASKDKAFWQTYRERYVKGIAISVGAFFDRVFAAASAKQDPAMMIYTSDHGQTFYERENPGQVTHCRNEPAIEEGAVPLVVLTRGDQDLDWTGAMLARHNRTSAYRIFPSLLLAMGYDAGEVRKRYGLSIVDRGDDPMTFGVGMLLKQAADPKWVYVDPDRVFLAQDPEREKSLDETPMN